ncbi:ATP-binding protein [Nocardiopsis synnemataformans]|uniref:ATP-binding protein n=1 Tax=Nocardiopsis synnemataformans TaxID=61305 RepID=UPI003EB9EC4F
MPHPWTTTNEVRRMQCIEPTNPPTTISTDLRHKLTAPQVAPAASHGQTFPGDRASVGEARVWLDATLRALRVPAAMTDSATLVLSELVSNAITHTRSGQRGGEVSVETLVHHQGLRTELTVRVIDDGATTVPRPREVSPDAEHGRGLFLVQALTQAWGKLSDGRCGVWARWSWPTLTAHPTWALGWRLDVSDDGSAVVAHHPGEDLTLVGPDLPSLRERVRAVTDVRCLREYYRGWSLTYDTSQEGPTSFRAQRRERLCAPGRGQVDEFTASTVGELRGRLLGQVAADRNTDRARVRPIP